MASTIADLVELLVRFAGLAVVLGLAAIGAYTVHRYGQWRRRQRADYPRGRGAAWMEKFRR